MPGQQWIERLSRLKPSIHRHFLATHPILPGLTAATIVFGIFLLSGWQPFERFAYTLLFKARERLTHETWDSRIVVIAIDEASLKQYGRFPWSRKSYTQLLEALQPAQPAVIGFDILFGETTAEDKEFAEAMESSGNVVLAIAADDQGYQISLVPAFSQVAHRGHVYHRPDADGITRQNQLYLNQFPSFGLVMLQVYSESIQNTIQPDGIFSSQAIALPPPNPTLAEQSMWLNWIAPVQTIPTYSFADVASWGDNEARRLTESSS
jgi:CHASE2 domain-containing sensor protein